MEEMKRNVILWTQISEATQYSMDVIIQYNTDFIVNTDQSLRAICTFNTSWNLGVRVGEVNASR